MNRYGKINNHEAAMQVCQTVKHGHIWRGYFLLNELVAELLLVRLVVVVYIPGWAGCGPAAVAVVVGQPGGGGNPSGVGEARCLCTQETD